MGLLGVTTQIRSHLWREANAVLVCYIAIDLSPFVSAQFSVKCKVTRCQMDCPGPS